MPLFIDKQDILETIPQERIFEKYGLPYREGLFRSTLRDDKNPTCSFYWKNGKLIMRDMSGHFWGDCFDLVQKVFSVRYGEALQIIGRDFGFEDGIEKKPILPLVPEKQRISIRVKRRVWTRETSTFWKEHGITKETVEKFKVSPAEVVWLNGEPVYKYQSDNPAYIYHFSDYDYQIYYPFAKAPNPRFLVSNGSLIHGFEQLPLQGELCIITKSRKDVMCFNEFNIPAVAPMAESVILPDEVLELLLHRFDNVISLMDYDNAGIHNAWSMRKSHNIKPLFFAEGTWRRKMGYRGAKDFSDYVRIYGKLKTEKLIHYVKRISSGSAD